MNSHNNKEKFNTENTDNKEQQENIKEKIELIINKINHFINDFHISEDEWITPEMYQDATEEGKEKFARYAKNKLRTVWFSNCLIFCAIGSEYCEPDIKQEFTKEIKNMYAELNENRDKKTRGMVEKMENIMLRLKEKLEEKLNEKQNQRAN